MSYEFLVHNPLANVICKLMIMKAFPVSSTAWRFQESPQIMPGSLIRFGRMCVVSAALFQHRMCPYALNRTKSSSHGCIFPDNHDVTTDFQHAMHMAKPSAAPRGYGVCKRHRNFHKLHIFACAKKESDRVILHKVNTSRA